jgi:hypothetical protein
MTRRKVYVLPIPLPPWAFRLLPTWWRVRRSALMMRRLDQLSAD